MDLILFIELVAVVVLLALSGFFSSAEVAFFSLDALTLRGLHEKHPASAKLIQALLLSPTRLLSTLLVCNTAINIGLAILGLKIMTTWFPRHGEWLSILVMTILILVFGEYGPKRIARIHAPTLARVYARPLMFSSWATTPLRTVLEMPTHYFNEHFRPRGHIFSDDEYRALIDMGGESGTLDEAEQGMMRAIIHLEEVQVAAHMTPRVELSGLDLNDLPEDVLAAVRQARVRHLVLYRDTIDHIVGLLDVRSFLLDPTHSLEHATREPYFVPELCPMDRLLSQMLNRHIEVCVAVDEYGGLAGLITRGDVLEVITGDMAGDFADKPEVFEQLTERSWLIDAGLSIDEVRQKTGLPLFSTEGSDRISGWVTERIERMPKVGDMVRGENFTARVHQMRRHRILLVVIEKDRPEEPGEEHV